MSKEAEISSQSESSQHQCAFYIERKKRYCKFSRLSDKEYCAEHLPRDDNGQFELKGKKRIPCPLDPKHSVFESKLQSHLKKCNARPINQGPFHKEDVNIDKNVKEPNTTLLGDVPIDRLKQLIFKIEQVYKDYIEVDESIEEHPILKSDLNNPEHQKCLKHRKQEASLIGNLAKKGWIKDGTVYAEFGAGRARLATYLIEIASDQVNSHFILIDRDHARNKCENKFKDQVQGPNIERLRIDIKDLQLEEYPKLKDCSKPVIVYSKHLCGSATDLTLRCLDGLNGTKQNHESSKRQKLDRCWVEGIQIALCCHHRCTWNTYYGREFWERIGLTADDFVIVRALTGWATCAFPSKDGTDHHDAITDEVNIDRYEGLNREDIGIKCKRLLDYGRMDQLMKLGYQAKLVIYTNRDVSLENVMLVASS